MTRKVKKTAVAEPPMPERYWVTGQSLTFTSKGGTRRRGEFIKVVKQENNGEFICEVKLVGDPFTVCVYESQLDKSPSETESEEEMAQTAKELRREAKNLNIEGWEDMGLGELRTAVAEASAETKPAKKAPAKKTTSRAKKSAEPVVEDDVDDEDEEVEEPAPKARGSKRTTAAKKAAPAKKAPAKKAAAAETDDAEPAENGNPFKAGTNMFELAELLIQGGKRTDLVKKAKRKIKLSPRDEREVDLDKELDRRLLICGQHLKKSHGFNVVRDGRGSSATIVAEPPA